LHHYENAFCSAECRTFGLTLFPLYSFNHLPKRFQEEKRREENKEEVRINANGYGLIV
jgi:hypothetical protein